MKLNNAHLLNYVDRIKFKQEEKAKYQPQIEALKKNVESYVRDHSNCNVIKVNQSGSWKKGTILHPKDGVDLDIDLVFYIDTSDSSEIETRLLNSKLKTFLFNAYPNKPKADFWDSPKTAGVVFKGTGLNFDIVPVVSIEPEPYVWQPEKGMKNFFCTSIVNQLKFNSDRKEVNPNYTAIVRILKKWKSKQELNLSSFSVENIVGWLDINEGVESNIEQGVLRTFKLIGKHKFPQITFKTPGIKEALNEETKGAVYIADPAYNFNNSSEYITNDDWEKIQEYARAAYENLMYAKELEGTGETIDLWKEVLGTSFNINPLEN